MRHITHVSETYNANAVQFVLTELDLGITFCQVGMTTRDPDHAARNAENAREALDGVLHFKTRVELTAEERVTIADKLSVLQSLLKQLHRRVRSLAVNP